MHYKQQDSESNDLQAREHLYVASNAPRVTNMFQTVNVMCSQKVVAILALHRSDVSPKLECQTFMANCIGTQRTMQVE